MVIKNINHIVIFGGTYLVKLFADIIKEKKIKCSVVSVLRQLDEVVKDNKTLREYLLESNVEYNEIECLDKFEGIYNLVDKNTLAIGLGEIHSFSKGILELFEYRVYDFMTIRLPQYRGWCTLYMADFKR
jgi:hypothetical protein